LKQAAPFMQVYLRKS